ncbi:HAMP domain-containing sensor histidine kinase [Sorangium sp. So ce1014]|uniref:sensor histidine kinase n=1 Tax=Sorangium sp. So ce1014 TaxID=3133326 RepID=UPI003F609D20
MKMSIGRRLSLLVLSQLLLAALGIITSIVAFRRLTAEAAYLRHYIFPPLVVISTGIESSNALYALLARPSLDVSEDARTPILRLRSFIDRYQQDWLTATSTLPDAVRLRAALQRAGELRLLEKEREAVNLIASVVTSLERTTGLVGPAPAAPSLRRTDVEDLSAALVQLNKINLRYMEVAYGAYDDNRRVILLLFLAVGLAGITAALLFGLAVRRAIAPRVRRMVAAVQRFRERGDYEPLGDWGDDELAVLAHTLNTSFKAIAERDKDRDRFLAVAAHELKTPLTIMKGFSQVALTHRHDAAVRERALAIIDRQTTRLGRLVHDLLWSARMSGGELPFKPEAIDIEDLARRVIGEFELAAKDHMIHLVPRGDAQLLGDPELLEQALWSLLVQAVAVALEHEPVLIKIDAASASRVLITIEVRGGNDLPEDLGKLLEPFAVVAFEGRRDEPRSTGIGLYLVQGIARLHGASFWIERRPGELMVFSLELRR